MLLENSGMVQTKCILTDDDFRWFVALVPDKDMRLAEATGLSLWAAKKIVAHKSEAQFAFPRYNRGVSTNANSGGAVINKWLKKAVLG